MLNCMVVNSGVMSIVMDSVVYTYAEAFSVNASKAQSIAESGVFHEGGVYVGKYYCEDSCKAESLYIGFDYPMENVVANINATLQEHAIVSKYIGLGRFELQCYLPEKLAELKEKTKTKYTTWIFKPLVQEPEVIEEPATVEEVKPTTVGEITEPEVTIEAVEPEVTAEKVIEPEVAAEIVEPVATAEEAYVLLIPVPCRGETWSECVEDKRIEDYNSDIDCIEDNWEKRGDYYITDCISRNVRLIYSETKNYSKEFELGDWAKST